MVARERSGIAPRSPLDDGGSMSEPHRLAKGAREHLAAALKALQSDEDVPDALMEGADPIAEAMGFLHRIERSQGTVLDGRMAALERVRASLDLLVELKVSHRAVDVATEAVALSVVKVASLARYVPQAGAPGVVAQPQ